MYATQDLRDEHEGIKIALAVLDRLANDLEAGKTVELDDVEQLVDFLKTFADKCHHGKEEELLFPALEKAGIPVDGGPIGVMLTDHTHGREFISAMNSALPGLRKGDAGAVKTFADAAHGYVNLLNDHIVKENTVLFVMAEQRLSPEEHSKMAEGFECIEQERIGPGVHERYHAMLDRLQHKYLS
ncbi:MAG: hemerythrin domain-containing protein [Armatimonadota bacterium]